MLLVAGLHRGCSGFDPRQDHAKYVVGRVALG